MLEDLLVTYLTTFLVVKLGRKLLKYFTDFKNKHYIASSYINLDKVVEILFITESKKQILSLKREKKQLQFVNCRCGTKLRCM